MLLLDAFHEGWDAHMPERPDAKGQDDPAPRFELTPELLQRFRGLYEQKLADWPPDLRELLIDRHLDQAIGDLLDRVGRWRQRRRVAAAGGGSG